MTTHFNRNEFVNSTLDVEDLKKVLEHDHKSFINLNLYDQEGIEEGVPDLHELVMTLMNSTAYDRIAIAIPRDHAKTTLAKLTAVRHFIFTRFRFLVYLSNTNPLSVQAVRDIVNFIRSPIMQSIFGPAEFIQAEEAKGNYIFNWCGKQCIIRALGAGQQIRGMNINNQRPDLLIIDDLEKADENEDNKLGYKSLKDWMYGTLFKAMDTRKNRIIQIGNLVNAKSTLADHIRSERWKSICMAAVTEDGKPLWPARWTIQELREDLLEYIREGRMYVWLSEMMNMPITTSNKLIKSENVMTAKPVDPNENFLLKCITVDPAITTNMRHAHSAVICVHVFNGEHWQLADKKIQKGADPYMLYNDIMVMAFKWGVRVVGIESEAYQEALLHIARKETAERGYAGFEFVPLKTMKKSKSSRIMAWVGMIKTGDYRLSVNDFDVWSELNNYNLHEDKNEDDLIDCCAYIVQMISKYLNVIAGLAAQGNEPAGHSLTPISHM